MKTDANAVIALGGLTNVRKALRSALRSQDIIGRLAVLRHAENQLGIARYFLTRPKPTSVSSVPSVVQP